MHAEEVAILLATRNGARYLPEQLQSILDQSYESWFIVTSDDGSTDDTRAIMAEFAKANPGRVIVVDHGPLHSARDNFLGLLRCAPNAQYYAFCDQDDVWAPDKLDKLVDKCIGIETHEPGIPCLAFSDLILVNDRLELVHPSFLAQMRVSPEKISYKTLLTENAIPGCSMLFNNALADIFRSRVCDQTQAIMHDWWVALLAAARGSVGYVSIPLMRYRQHGSNTLGAVKRHGWTFTLAKLLHPDRTATMATYGQASEFARTYGDLLRTDVARTIKEFGSLPDHPKVRRILTLITLGTVKQTPARCLYQLLRA